MIKNEAIQTFTQEALDFLKQDNDETLDDTIKKMEAFKNLLEPDCEESEFDELIQMVKTAKEAIENLNKSTEYDDDYYEDLMNDDLPQYYWGGEDGNEIIFLRMKMINL